MYLKLFFCRGQRFFRIVTDTLKALLLFSRISNGNIMRFRLKMQPLQVVTHSSLCVALCIFVEMYIISLDPSVLMVGQSLQNEASDFKSEKPNALTSHPNDKTV